MADKHDGLALKKPVSVWNRNVNLDFAQLFNALASAVRDHQIGNVPGMAKDLFAVVKSVSLANRSPQELGWLLVHTAMSRAIALLTEEAVTHSLLKPPSEVSEDDLAEQLDQMLGKNHVSISARLFTDPGSCELVNAMVPPFQRWLQAFGLPEPRATAMSGRLRPYFVQKLRQEWLSDPESYQVLRERVVTPFDESTKRSVEWLAYVAMLEAEVERPVFGEAFSLNQIYMDLRATFRVTCKKAAGKRPANRRDPENLTEEEETVRVAVDLDSHLREWVVSPPSEGFLKVISGGPGSGKSSFCAKFAARHAEELVGATIPVRTLLIRLHHFDPRKDLAEAVGRYLRQREELSWNPLEELGNGELLLLIFDGLDELSQTGRTGEDVARSFVMHLNTELQSRNANGLKVRALLTGREVVIQANEGQFRSAGCELKLVPYLLEKEDLEGVVDPHNLLQKDQRIGWWEKYGDAIGQDLSGMTEKLNSPNLRELTSQPLLNYLVALSRETVDLTDETSLNEVYFGLIQRVYQRAWSKEGLHPALRAFELKETQFFLILEEIALTAWHGDGRKTTVGAIRANLEGGTLSGLLDRFEKGAELGVVSLLTAFYFRQVEQDGGPASRDRTFEFTHKSFGEYLTARRLVRLMNRIIQERKRGDEGLGEGWSIPDALVEWARATGPTRMDRYRFDFLIREVKTAFAEQEPDAVNMAQSVFATLFSYAVQTATPMEKVALEDLWWFTGEESCWQIHRLPLFSRCGWVSSEKWQMPLLCPIRGLRKKRPIQVGG